MQQSKIDAVVNQIIDQVRKQGYGFTLDLAGDARTHIREVQSHLRALTEAGGDNKTQLACVLRNLEDLDEVLSRTAITVNPVDTPIDEYEKPADWRGHRIGDVDSFVEYVQTYGSPVKSLVLINETGCTVSLDEKPERGERELVHCPFTFSDDWRAWEAALSQAFAHRDLHKFLERQEHNLTDAHLLGTLRSLKLNSQIDFESDVQGDGNKIGLTFKTNGGQELKNFKRQMRINLPILETDVLAEDQWVSATVKLDVDLPRDPQGEPKFSVICPEWSTLKLKRLQSALQWVREQLGSEFTVLLGTHQTRPRVIGRGHRPAEGPIC